MGLVVPSSLTVNVDSRERTPLPFPGSIRWFPNRFASTPQLIRIHTKTVKMDAGDYCFAGLERRCIIERKNSIDELYGNVLTADYARFTKALDRLTAATKHPILLIESTPSQLWTASRVCDNPARAWHCFNAELAKRGIPLMWAATTKNPGSRRVLGEQLLGVMLSVVFQSGEDQQ